MSDRSIASCPVDPGVAGRTNPRRDIPPPDVRRPRFGPLGTDPFLPTRHPLSAARAVAAGRLWKDPVPVGPRGLPGAGVWHDYTREPYEYVRRAAAEYGDVFRLPLPVRDVTIFNHPDFVDQILCDRDGNYHFIGALPAVVERQLANVTILEGSRFEQRRRSYAPMFSRRTMSGYSGAIAEELTARIDAWAPSFADAGEPMDLVHELAMITLPAFMRSMYSTSFPHEHMVQLDKDIRTMMRFLGSVALGPVLWPGNPASVPASYLRVRRLIQRMIDQRLANPIESTDLLQVVLEAKESDGTPIPRSEMVADLGALMAGGFDTVVNAVGWAFALLSLNPEANEKFVAEVDQVLGGRVPTIDDLKQLSWSKACFDEAQRLQGGTLHVRYATRDVEVAGFPMRKGTLVGVTWHTMHRDPRWWPEPDRYDPSRFTDQEVIKARPGHAFLPFSAGPHHCIGSAMAYMNGVFMMALIAQRYTVTTPAGWKPRHQFALATAIEGGVPVTLTRRKPNLTVGA